jgi:hypothetical protein
MVSAVVTYGAESIFFAELATWHPLADLPRY